MRAKLLIGADSREVQESLTKADGLSSCWTTDVLATAEFGSIAEFHLEGII